MTTATAPDYLDIADICYHQAPALIYIAIGCAQGHNHPRHRTPQQFPPFIRAIWPTGGVVAVLIDPALEPDDELQGLTDADGDPTVSFITVREEFHWDSPHATAFITRLCELLMSQLIYTRLIIQDYTGAEISGRLLPFLQQFGRNLASRALFDTTYGTMGGCYLDFSTVSILRDPGTGYFIQPQYLTLTDALAEDPPVPPEHLHRTTTERIHTLRQYAHRTLQYLTTPDTEEPRPAWLSDAAVLAKLAPIAYVYGVPLLRSVTPDRLMALLTRFMEDLAAAADATVPTAELIASDQLSATMYLLRDIALGCCS